MSQHRAGQHRPLGDTGSPGCCSCWEQWPVHLQVPWECCVGPPPSPAYCKGAMAKWGWEKRPFLAPQTQLVRSNTSLLALQRSLNLTAKSQAAAETVWFSSLFFFQYFARPFSGQIIDSTAEQMPWAACSTLAAGSWGKGERNDCVLICH